MSSGPVEKDGRGLLMSVQQALGRGSGLLVTAALVVLAFAVSWAEHGRDYATTVVIVVVALGLHVWLFAAALLIISRLLLKRTPAPSLLLMAALAVITAALHVYAPVSLVPVAEISAVIAILLFLGMALFGRALR